MNILNDTEHRIFLSAMAREKEVCQKIDGDKIYDTSVKMLVPVCESIERKVDRAIPLDKVKQAKKEIESLSQYGAKFSDEFATLIDRKDVLEIINKLIAESEG